MALRTMLSTAAAVSASAFWSSISLAAEYTYTGVIVITDRAGQAEFVVGDRFNFQTGLRLRS